MTAAFAPVRTDPGRLQSIRTVDRTLVHRHSLSEVFLTDHRPVSRSHFVAAAQLPASHAYYTDSPQRPRLVDPLLLLECARQAETFGGHAQHEVELGTSFVLRSWSLSVRPASLPAAGRPVDLTLDVHTSGERRVGGRLRGITYDIAMSARPLDRLAQVRIVVGYLDAHTYRSLRTTRRGSAPPSSAEWRPTAGELVPPYRVGRLDPRNVVLSGCRVVDGELRATVRVPVDNPSMFDHPQDHVPGMVLMEAARQTALVALAQQHGLAPERTVLRGLTGSFSRYAEMDRPVELRLPLRAVHLGAGMPVEVAQDGASVARLTLAAEEVR